MDKKIEVLKTFEYMCDKFSAFNDGFSDLLNNGDTHLGINYRNEKLNSLHRQIDEIGGFDEFIKLAKEITNHDYLEQFNGSYGYWEKIREDNDGEIPKEYLNFPE